MKNMPLIVLSALVITGVIGVLIVMNSQTTGQAYYQIQERPPVFYKVLTTEKCELMQAKKHLGEQHCLTEGRTTCNLKYPASPGGAENYCLQVCINKINEDCLR
jgi:hypothetical protein